VDFDQHQHTDKLAFRAFGSKCAWRFDPILSCAASTVIIHNVLNNCACAIIYDVVFNVRLVLCGFFLATWSVGAQTNLAVRAEQIRAECIQGRRYVCGRVLQVTKTGLVIDSGYPSLLQPPLNRSWVTRANAAPARPAALVESSAPDSIAVGLLFLTDIPKRPAVHQYDFVSLHGYPAGHYDYVPVPGVTKTIRRFSGGLETAVRLNLQASAPSSRLLPAAYLRMPDRADGSLPPLLSGLSGMFAR
jgi:hypothetical protein